MWFQTRALLCDSRHLAGTLFSQKPLHLCLFSNFLSGRLFFLTFPWKNGTPLPPNPTLLSCSVFFLASLELLNMMLYIFLLTVFHARMETTWGWRLCSFPEPELDKCSGVTDIEKDRSLTRHLNSHRRQVGTLRESSSTGRLEKGRGYVTIYFTWEIAYRNPAVESCTSNSP